MEYGCTLYIVHVHVHVHVHCTLYGVLHVDHEHDIFYIDFIMIKLVSLEILLNYIIQFILCFFLICI